MSRSSVAGNSKGASLSHNTLNAASSDSTLRLMNIAPRCTNTSLPRITEQRKSQLQTAIATSAGRSQASSSTWRPLDTVVTDQAANIITEGKPPNGYSRWLTARRLNQPHSVRDTGTGDHRRENVIFPQCRGAPERETVNRPTSSGSCTRDSQNQPESQVSNRPVQDEGNNRDRESQGQRNSEALQSESGHCSQEKIVNTFIIDSSPSSNDRRGGGKWTTPVSGDDYKCCNGCKKLSDNFLTNYQTDFSCNRCCGKVKKVEEKGDEHPKRQPSPPKLKDNQHLPCMRRDINYVCYEMSAIKHIDKCHSQWRNSEWLKSDYQANFSCPHCLYHSSKDNAVTQCHNRPGSAVRHRRCPPARGHVRFQQLLPAARRPQAGPGGVNVSNNRKVSCSERPHRGLNIHAVHSPCVKQKLTKCVNPSRWSTKTVLQKKASPASGLRMRGQKVKIPGQRGKEVEHGNN